MSTQLTRRSVARGAAWTIPAVAVAGSAPATAASPQCTLRVRGGLGTTYGFGNIRTSAADPTTTNQRLTMGGIGYVDGLPAGATVTAMTFNYWFEQRPAGQTGPGAPPITQSSLGSGKNYTFTPTAGSGYSTTVVNDATNSPQLYPDGVTRNSWNARMTWSSADNTLNSYTTDADGCRNFQTGESGKFYVVYNNVRALTQSDVDAGKESVHSFVTVTATVQLADKTTQQLSRTYQSVLT